MTWLIFGMLPLLAEASTTEIIAERARRIRAEHPDVAALIDGSEPRRNRAGQVYFPGGFGDSEHVQLLLLDAVLHSDKALDVRVSMAHAVAEPQAWALIEKQAVALRVALLEGHKGTDDASVLIAAAKDPSPDVSAAAVRLLGYSKAPPSADVSATLVAALSSQTGEVRRLAARSLGWRNDASAFDALVKLLTDQRPGVREAAVRALGRIDSKRASELETLRTLEGDGHPGTARAVKAVLNRAD